VLGVLNYRRDQVQVDVSLQWDMDVTPGSGYDPTKKWGVVRIHNIGRRPTFVSHVSIPLPSGYDHDHILAVDSVVGATLREGDAPKIYLMTQDGMERYAKDWRKLTAEVTDSTGRIWKAPRVPKNRRPSWAEAKTATEG
jgi:hypothetical protein